MAVSGQIVRIMIACGVNADGSFQFRPLEFNHEELWQDVKRVLRQAKAAMNAMPTISRQIRKCRLLGRTCLRCPLLDQGTCPAFLTAGHLDATEARENIILLLYKLQEANVEPPIVDDVVLGDE